MERSSRKDTFFPTRCPGCNGVVHLLVRNSGQITLHVHNAGGCNLTFYYRCWIEQGLPLPRLEFLDPVNAKHFTLHPHPGEVQEATTAQPAPPPSRFAPVPSHNAGGELGSSARSRKSRSRRPGPAERHERR